MIFLLVTDHVSLDQRSHALVRSHIQAAGPIQVAISIITVEEQMRGWIVVLRAATTPEARVTAYHRLRMAVEYFASVTLLDYDRVADALAAELRHQGVRIGTQNLRIAAIALARDATLVTRNRRDFGLVPRLRIEDWSQPTAP